MKLMHALRDAESVNALIGDGHGWIPSPVALPARPETNQTVSVHSAMRAIAMNKQQGSKSQKVFVPLKTRQCVGERGQAILERSRAVVISDNEMDLTLGQIRRQRIQPIERR